MIALYKPTLLSIAFCLAVTTSILSSSAFAQEQDEKVTVKHKVFKIKSSSDKPTKIEIEENGEVKLIEVNMKDFNDQALLESKLINLDEDTRATVLKIIRQSGRALGNGLAFIDTENESSFTLDNIKFDGNFNGQTEIIVVKDGENADFKGILKGHKQAIVKLIEKGEFTRDELNEIQKALDAKY